MRITIRGTDQLRAEHARAVHAAAAHRAGCAACQVVVSPLAMCDTGLRLALAESQAHRDLRRAESEHPEVRS